MNIAYLNINNLKLQEVKTKISRAVDDLMTLHRNHKGIIHTTSYKQLNFIKENISQTNKRRLLQTDPEISREEIISEHANSINPTVLISPSLHLGLDLKDDLSRFQIIIKVPYPDLGDRWINEKRRIYEEWYIWQTALRLVQAYGRSIRSKEDWAKTYVLDSTFLPFVKKNTNILPNWFIQAIQSDLLEAPLGHAAFVNNSKVHTTSKENDNAVISHYNPSIISEQTLNQNVNTTEKNEIAFFSAGLDSYIEDQSNRPEPVFVCPYCQFSSTLEREYQRHVVLKHRGKSGYRNASPGIH